MPGSSEDLPLVLAGPMLRRLTAERVTLWLATREPVRVRLAFDRSGEPLSCHELEPGDEGCRDLRAGRHLHFVLLDVTPEQPLPEDCWVGYDLALRPLGNADADWQRWTEWAPDLCFPGRDRPGFVTSGRTRALLHGSCRKPHHDGGDALVQADDLLARCLPGGLGSGGEAGDELPAWPAALVLTGDQIYADDVAGPMLRAVHGLLARLELPVERLAGVEDGAGPVDSDALYQHPACYYRRESLLPRRRRNFEVMEVLFGGVEKPVFTTDSAHNHLITLGEVLAMYLLVWSPAVWQGLELEPPPWLGECERARYAHERAQVEKFAEGLAAVRRLFAHLPVAMIFDDHDVTDDWNLSREWEEVAYGHPFSRRIIGNALIGYLLHQGWGNDPDAFPAELIEGVQAALEAPGSGPHDECIDALLHFERWHYRWPGEPTMLVADTRTRRWRSERAARSPSGLMDWEAITDLQQELHGRRSVLLVSPAPIFGVKLIEAVQRVFTWLGHPLMVDAENWMAHRGAAECILNVFRHSKTPQHFVVLSGDVHYSFVYDVELRGRERGPDIWQICSSGLRNEFPPRLLDVLDRANRVLYSPRSPLNWFTQRRRMRVVPRKPEGTPHGRRLLNRSGIGLVELTDDGEPWRVRELTVDGRMVRFTRREEESRWE